MAANFNSGKIDVLDRNFNPTSLGGSFVDPKLAPGFAPHGIHVIGNQIYVAYAMQDAAKHDAQPGAGLGQVDIFDMNGNFISTFVAAGGKHNAPWGVVTAQSTFGTFPNAILVGNFGDGTINAFDTTGKFLGQLTDSSKNTLVNPGLWDLLFGGGGPSGDPNTLYLTAGGGNQPNFPAGGSTTSVFASVVPAAAVAGPDFSLTLSAQSVTVAPGASANLMIGASAVGGFNSQIRSPHRARWSDVWSQSNDHLARIQRVILDLDHLCRHDPAAQRLLRTGHGGCATWYRHIRNRSHDAQTEIAYAQEHLIDKRTGVVAPHLTVFAWLQ